MKVITLSDHVGDQIRAAEAQQKAKALVTEGEYKQRLADYCSKALLLREKRLAAFHRNSFVVWILLWLKSIHCYLVGPPSCPDFGKESDEMGRWRAGKAGEDFLSRQLMTAFGTEWVLIDGYKNKGGEIDKLMIGPAGVLAIEVKNINGEVQIDGDVWKRNKYDNYGNCVETNLPIQDRGGRSPSMQVNSASDELESLLARRRSPAKIRRAVIFTHERATLGSVRNATVDLVALSRDDALIQQIGALFNSSAAVPADQIIGILCDDARRAKHGNARRSNNQQQSHTVAPKKAGFEQRSEATRAQIDVATLDITVEQRIENETPLNPSVSINPPGGDKGPLDISMIRPSRSLPLNIQR